MIFIVNYYQYKVRCNKAIPVSGHWDDTIYCNSHLLYDYLFRSPCLPILPLC
ncbi:hypothetical protein [Wolbachia endosymbiont (group A) of Bibio marci]|uniref:hypothetical protein n=1 Tax=Wolbachia endosymbiont (group A) of Bibio marci TaxID=2953987 RepID=UPI0022325DB8|nr:hypothetical protein [Wolbachia endosymbiont (group A) of Bibio marci]